MDDSRDCLSLRPSRFIVWFAAFRDWASSKDVSTDEERDIVSGIVSKRALGGVGDNRCPRSEKTRVGVKRDTIAFKHAKRCS